MTMRRLLMTATAVLALGAAGLSAAAPRPDPQGDSATRGLYVALRVCAACHAVAARGSGADDEAPTEARLAA